MERSPTGTCSPKHRARVLSATGRAWSLRPAVGSCGKVYDELIGLNWQWQSVDDQSTAGRGKDLQYPTWGRNERYRPTCPAFLLAWQSMEQKFTTHNSFRHTTPSDTQLLQETIADCVDRAVSEWQNLCLDKTHDSTAVRKLIESVYGYTSNIRSRGEEKLNKIGDPARVLCEGL